MEVRRRVFGCALAMDLPWRSRVVGPHASLKNGALLAMKVVHVILGSVISGARCLRADIAFSGSVAVSLAVSISLISVRDHAQEGPLVDAALAR
jgi:hypothetical protein